MTDILGQLRTFEDKSDQLDRLHRELGQRLAAIAPQIAAIKGLYRRIAEIERDMAKIAKRGNDDL